MYCSPVDKTAEADLSEKKILARQEEKQLATDEPALVRRSTYIVRFEAYHTWLYVLPPFPLSASFYCIFFSLWI